MYIRVGRRIICAGNITDTEEFPPEAEGQERALAVSFVGGRSVTLRGKEADALLQALPTYEPVEEE